MTEKFKTAEEALEQWKYYKGDKRHLDEIFDGWKSPEEVQVLKEELEELERAFSRVKAFNEVTRKNFNEACNELSKVRKEHKKPVLPKFVADWVEQCKTNNISLAYCINFEREDNRIAFDWLITGGLSESRRKQEILARAWLYGYEIEQEKLFYLKHIDMSENSKNEDVYMQKIYSDMAVSHAFTEKGELPKSLSQCKFTQSEIDKLHTGSYEQIEAKE